VVVEVVHVPALLVVVAVAVGQVLELGSESKASILESALNCLLC
jgi:hypothetical protein